jgi:hypothetical protein
MTRRTDLGEATRLPKVRQGLRKLAELNRIGEGWYIAKRTVAFIMAAESVVMLVASRDVLLGKAPWHTLRDGLPFFTFFFVGIFSVVVGAVASMREVARLREQFDEVDEETPA